MLRSLWVNTACEPHLWELSAASTLWAELTSVFEVSWHWGQGLGWSHLALCACRVLGWNCWLGDLGFLPYSFSSSTPLAQASWHGSLQAARARERSCWVSWGYTRGCAVLLHDTLKVKARTKVSPNSVGNKPAPDGRDGKVTLKRSTQRGRSDSPGPHIASGTVVCPVEWTAQLGGQQTEGWIKASR